MKADNDAEWLPIVDEQGNVTGKATRGECHNGKTMLLHPVVHLHVLNGQGELLLQHRPTWKTIQPDKWDTAVGGHVDYGETIEHALRREVGEEIGITDFSAKFLCRYVHQSDVERELVYVYATHTDKLPKRSDEVDDLRFFSTEELKVRMGNSFFTPNFEKEWEMLNQRNLL